MKALFLSSDREILKQGSAVARRMREYADAIGTLHIILRTDEAAGYTDGPLTVHGVRSGKLFAMARMVREGRALIRSEGIDVVSAQDPFEYGMMAVRAVRGTTAKLHIQVHTDFLSPWFVRSGNPRSPKVAMPFLNRARRHMAGGVLLHANGIRVVSRRIKDSLLLKYGSAIKEPSVIPISVPFEVPAVVPLPQLSFTFVLITVSRLEPEKRIEDIITALAQIRDSHPSVGLVVVGEGSERTKLVKLAQKLGVTERIEFLGARADAWGLMRSATAYIQASAYEGYGRTLIEAGLARLPIITTDVGIVGEVYKGYEDVFAVPPADPSALAQCIRNLVENHQSREVLGRDAEIAARAHVAAQGNQAEHIARDLERTLHT